MRETVSQRRRQVVPPERVFKTQPVVRVLVGIVIVRFEEMGFEQLRGLQSFRRFAVFWVGGKGRSTIPSPNGRKVGTYRKIAASGHFYRR